MTTVESRPDTSAADDRPDAPGVRRRAGLAGLVALLAALGVGELVAAWAGPATSPVVAVGQGVIRVVPEAVKRLAIAVFGTYDKVALVTGTLLLLVVAAVLLGRLALRNVTLALLGIMALAVVGALAAATAPAAGPLAILPSGVGGIAGVAALQRLVRPLGVPRPGTPSTGPDRRAFLRTAGVVTAVAAVAGGIGVALRARFDVTAARKAVRLPAATDPAPALAADLSEQAPGITRLVTSNTDFYRIDTALSVPQVDPKGWSLRIHGMVENEIEVTYDDLLAEDLVERYLTLACVSNEVGGGLAGTAKFLGVPIARLLERAKPQEGADQVFSTSVDGFTASVQLAALTDGRDALLAVGMNGEPLPVEHGFPVRMVVPGLYGYVSATKWVTDLEVTTYSRRRAYWSDRGWSEKGPVKTFSRIDTPRDGADRSAGTVVVAGMAWAMHRGIQAVEVKVDDGDWVAATLSDEDDPDLWRQWYYAWDAPKGDHTLTVRATDGDGVVQTSAVASPAPDGATGLHSVDVGID